MTCTDAAQNGSLFSLLVTVANLCRCFLWARPKAGTRSLESSLEFSSQGLEDRGDQARQHQTLVVSFPGPLFTAGEEPAGWK